MAVMKTLLFFLPIAFFLSGCMRQNPQVIKETDANKKVVLSFYNLAYNQKDAVKAVDSFTGNAEVRSIQGDTLLRGRTEIANSVINFLSSFKDVSFKSEWSYAEGETVILRWKITCTPKENYLTHPAGKPMVMRGATFCSLFERKIYNSFTYWNFN